jgi:hypothetical protein
MKSFTETSNRRYAVQRAKIRTTRFHRTGRDSGKSPLLSGKISSRCGVIAPVKITLSCNIFLPNAFKQDGSTFRLRCDLLAVIVSAGRLRPPAMRSNSWDRWKIFCAVFRRRYVDGAMHDAMVPWAAHCKARMLPFANPTLKSRSLFNNFWKLAAIIRNRRLCFGNQNAIQVEGKRRKIEEQS